MLVDVANTEKSCQYSAVSEDDIASMYQFINSSANVQPTDKGMTFGTRTVNHSALESEREKTFGAWWKCRNSSCH